jgi:hypothetical protein
MLIGVFSVLLEPGTTVPRGAALPRPAAGDGPPARSATRSYRPPAAAGLGGHDAGGVLAGAPPAGAGPQQVQLAAVDRERVYRCQGLAAAGTGVVDGRDRGAAGVVDDGFRGDQPISGTGRDQDAGAPGSDHRS